MGLFSRASKGAGKAVSREAFQACIAAGILMAASDGKIDREETEKTINVVAVNDTFKAFSRAEIQKQSQAYATLITTDARMGRLKLLKEIEDVGGNVEIGEQVFITAISVGESSGDGIGDKEYQTLVKIGEILGLKPQDYDVQEPKTSA